MKVDRDVDRAIKLDDALDEAQNCTRWQSGVNVGRAHCMPTHISFNKSLYIFLPTTYNLEVKAWRFFNVQ